MAVDNLAGQHLSTDLQRPTLLDQRLRLRLGDAVQTGELLEAAGFHQSPVRHDAQPLEMRRPIFAKVDVFDIPALRHRAIQRPVIEAEIFLLQLCLQILRQSSAKDLARSFHQWKRARPGQLLCLGKLHQIKDERLFGKTRARIDQAGKEPPRQNAAHLRIDIGPPLGEQSDHRL